MLGYVSIWDRAHPSKKIFIDLDGKIAGGDESQRVGQRPDDQGDLHRQADGRSYANVLHHKKLERMLR